MSKKIFKTYDEIEVYINGRETNFNLETSERKEGSMYRIYVDDYENKSKKVDVDMVAVVLMDYVDKEKAIEIIEKIVEVNK